ncbi:MAG TPA: hypothetical protein GYA03_04910 [Tissierellia bacterium]|nr:hypothetical protein [Tissierellia bacterium]
MEFNIGDKNILRAISIKDTKVISLRFGSDAKPKNKTFITIKARAKDPFTAYALGEHLRINFIKTLVITQGIEAIRIEDKIQYKLINKKQIQAMQLPVIACDGLYATISIPYHEINQTELECNLKNILKSNEETNEGMF